MNKKTIPLSICITLLFTILYVISIAFIISYSYYSNSQAIFEISDALIKKTAEKVYQSTKDHLSPVITYSRQLALVLNQNILKKEDLEKYSTNHITDTEKYYLNILHHYPQIKLIYYGTKNGYFFCGEKLENGITEVIKNYPDGTKVTSWGKHVDSEYRIVKVEKNPPQYEGYDPRRRGWYKAAKAKEGFNLTDMYVFVSGMKTLGITASMPLKDENGEFYGVAACDIVLSEISKYLENLKIGKSGKAVIIDNNGQIVAYPGKLSNIMIDTPEELRVKNIEEMGLDWLKKADKEYRKSQRTNFFVQSGDINYIISVKPFFQQYGKDWKIVVSVPEDEFIGELKKNNKIILIFTVIIFFISLFFIYAISLNISKPLVLLAEEANHLKELKGTEKLEISSRIFEIEDLAAAISKLKSGTLAFKKFVPEELIRNLIMSGEKAELKGEDMEITIFFSKIKGFSKIIESLPPEYLMLHLAEYLDEVSQIILNTNGTIDKYVGDVVMSFWGAPVKNEKQAYDCCRAAVMIKRRLSELNRKWEREHKAQLHTFMGIHTGDAIVGNFGSTERMNYTLLGDSVNLSSRLKDVNELYGTEIIISQSTYSSVIDEFVIRPLGSVLVKGKERPVMIYELMDFKDDKVSEQLIDLAEGYTEVYEEFINQKWDSAIKLINKLESIFPTDIPLEKLKKKCLKYRDGLLDDDWHLIDTQFRDNEKR